MQTMIELECGFCGKKIQRRATEHNRCLKKGFQASFCSRKCANSREIHKINIALHRSNYDISQHSVRDEYSPFRPHLNSIKGRCKVSAKDLECSLTLEDLKEIWDKQDGICPYTGVKLINHLATPNKSHHTERSPYRASVDRIDSSKGYTKDNVQFISLIAQYAKNDWDEEELLDFCEKVSNYRKK